MIGSLNGVLGFGYCQAETKLLILEKYYKYCVFCYPLGS